MKYRQIVLLLAVDAVLVFPSASAEPGFLGSYYAGSDLATLQFERADDVIEFDWGRESPDARIPEDGFSVVWTATLTPPLSGSYEFIVMSVSCPGEKRRRFRSQ